MPAEYTSPGFAVANTIDGILQQRKAEQRQAMLDALNQKNVESEISARNENADSNREDRAAQADERRAQAYQRSVSQFHMGQPLTDIAPDLLTEMIKRGAATPGTYNEGTADTDSDFGSDNAIAPSGAPPTAVGTPAENDLAQKNADRDAFIRSGVLDEPGISIAHKAALAQRHGITLPENVLNPPVKKPVWTIMPNNTYRGPNGEISQTPPDGAQIVRGFQPRTPPAPKEAGFYSWDEPGVNGAPPTHVGGFFNPPVLKPGESQAVDLSGFRKGNAPNPPAEHGNGLYDATAYSKLQSVVTNQNAQPTDIQRAQTNVINSVGGPHPTPDALAIRHWLEGVIWDPSHWDMPLATIKKQLIDSGADDASAQKAVEIFSAVMIPDVAGPAGSTPAKPGLLDSLLHRGK